MSNAFGKVQKLGKALMLPVAVLPIAAILLRIGQGDLLNLPFVSSAGGALFTNLALLFAIGVSIGIAKDGQGAAGLAGAVGYLILKEGTAAIDPEINMSVLAGMIAGIVAGNLYNKFHNVKLPDWLGFFSGKRFVPIVTGLTCIILAGIFGFIWPPIQGVIDATGKWMIGAGAVGVFSFGFLNRLLIPVGLHHVLNSFVWFVFGNFDGATGDLHRYFAGDPNAGIFMAGFYLIMMFGLPAAALAMYSTAKKKNRPMVGGALFSVAFTAFLTGITEPIEFLFMFLAPVLYVAHAILTGIAMAVCYVLNIKHGFGFSAGLFDYVLNMKFATNGLWLIPLGLVFFIVYYLLFVVIIKKFNLPTPGRLEDLDDESSNVVIKQDGIANLAKAYIEALGGSDNIEQVDACITRLRLSIKNADMIDDSDLKALGATGVLRPNAHNMQVVVGTKAELVADQMKKML
ncbi:MAG: N-acetylglucosamine-specific PTS transporter subunit IIBC [Tissierellales bacterium]|jgi:PTS system N-acetylglucosamine-specific IIC component|nr:N-acetylglucosamine-specific PTS transporter subunit IIBC [Tissierellales bacterium]